MFTLPTKKRNQGILVIFHLFQWWVYQPENAAARFGHRASGRDQGGHETAQRLAEEQQRVEDGPPGLLGPFGTLGTLGRPWGLGKAFGEICGIGFLDGDQMVTKWTTVFFSEI